MFVRAISNSSRIVQLIFKVRQEGLGGRFLWSSSEQGAVQEEGLDDAIYRTSRDAQWQEAWRVTEALLVAMRDEVRTHGARLIIVTLSNSSQVHPDPIIRQQFLRRLGVDNLFHPDRRIKTFGERMGIEVIILAPILQQYAEQHHLFLHGFPATGLGRGHWNAQGHRVAGELIAQYFCASH